MGYPRPMPQMAPSNGPVRRPRPGLQAPGRGVAAAACGAAAVSLWPGSSARSARCPRRRMSRRARTIPLPRVHTMGSSSMLDPPAPGGCIPSRIESRRERSGGAWDGSVDADSRCVCVCVCVCVLLNTTVNLGLIYRTPAGQVKVRSVP